MANLPLLPQVEHYRKLGCVPGGTERNFASYGHKAGALDQRQRQLLCDPQTSGGLLLAVANDHAEQVADLLSKHGVFAKSIGELFPLDKAAPLVCVN
jgi:selenide,water dikinase